MKPKKYPTFGDQKYARRKLINELANKPEIINAINAQWGADVPEVNIAALAGPPFKP